MSLKYRDKNGVEVVLAGLTPGGDLAFGASTTRSGTTESMTINSGSGTAKQVTFSDAMPDDDYEVVFSIAPNYSYVILTTGNKTASGFNFMVTNEYNQALTFTVSWKAFKLYDVEHAEQNASDIADIKAKIPSTASSSNKLATSKQVTDLETALDERIDDLEEAVPVNVGVQNKLVSASQMTTALNAKQDTLTFDTTPTEDSSNPVTSDGIKAALDGIVLDAYKYKNYEHGADSGVSLDDLTENQIFTIWGNNTEINAPETVGAWWEGIVIRLDGNPNYCIQIVFYSSNTKIVRYYARNCNNNVWSAWREFASMNDIQAITDMIPSSASSSNKLVTASDITSITDVIPSGASSSNKLVTASENNFTYNNKVSTISDLDTLTVPGVYSCNISNATTGHAPVAGWNQIYVTRANGDPNYVQQIDITIGGNLYVRVCQNKNWGAWKTATLT